MSFATGDASWPHRRHDDGNPQRFSQHRGARSKIAWVELSASHCDPWDGTVEAARIDLKPVVPDAKLLPRHYVEDGRANRSIDSLGI
jgi:hypothetical protein